MMNTLDVASYQQPIRKSAQRLRWFFRSFEEQVARVSAETGIAYSVDNATLAAVFADWLKPFNAQKPTSAEDKPAYVGFAAGLMLQALIAKRPASVIAKPAAFNPSTPPHYWPEGYLYVTYCLHVRSLVIEIDYHGQQTTNDALGDIRTWRSFTENVEEDPTMAISFLDLFAGEEPDWKMPGMFRKRAGGELLGYLGGMELIRPVV